MVAVGPRILSTLKPRPKEGLPFRLHLTWGRLCPSYGTELLEFRMPMSTLQSGLNPLPRVYNENGVVEFRNSCRAALKGSEKQVGGGGHCKEGQGKLQCDTWRGIQRARKRREAFCANVLQLVKGVGSGTWVDALVCLGIQSIGPGRRWKTENMASRMG